MARRFEADYRVTEADDVLDRENAIHRDIDLRLDDVEKGVEAFRSGQRDDIEAILNNLGETYSGLAAEMRGLLDQAEGGLSADIIVETANRRFLTDARRAAILADALAQNGAKSVAKAGDIMVGILTLMFANPYLVFKNTDGGVNNNADWRILHFGPDGRLYFQNTDKNGAGVNAFSFGRGGDLNAAGMGDVKGYVDRGIRSDFFQGLSRVAQLTAKKNISVETGRRYYTGNGGVANITAADIGGLVYLESDINTCNFPLAASHADGDYVWLYARGTVTVKATPGDPYIFGFAYSNSGVFVMQPGDRCKISMGADAWDVVSYTTRHDKALMVDRSQSFNDAERKQLYANAGISIAAGQCRLELVSGSELRLKQCNGDKVLVNGVYLRVPPEGLPISNAGLTAGASYFAYMTWDGSKPIMIAQPYPPTIDPISGMAVSSAYNFHVYVGKFYVDGDGQFKDSPGKRYVLTHFNKRMRSLRGAAGTYSTSSQQSVELSTGARAMFVSDGLFAMSVLAGISGNGGSGATSPGYSIYAAPSLNGVDYSPTALAGTPAYGGSTMTILDFVEVGDGLHYLTVKGQTVGNYSANFNGAVVGMVMI